jgi:hypothetical protein
LRGIERAITEEQWESILVDIRLEENRRVTTNTERVVLVRKSLEIQDRLNYDPIFLEEKTEGTDRR